MFLYSPSYAIASFDLFSNGIRGREEEDDDDGVHTSCSLYVIDIINKVVNRVVLRKLGATVELFGGTSHVLCVSWKLVASNEYFQIKTY